MKDQNSKAFTSPFDETLVFGQAVVSCSFPTLILRWLLSYCTSLQSFFSCEGWEDGWMVE